MAEERRKRILTDEDLEDIRSAAREAAREAVKEAACACPNGLTVDDARDIRSFVRWWNDARATVGKMVIQAAIVAMLALAGLGAIKFGGK